MRAPPLVTLLVLCLVATARAQIAFETVPSGPPAVDGLQISGQYRPTHGVTFDLDTDDDGCRDFVSPVLEARGTDGVLPGRDGQDSFQCGGCVDPLDWEAAGATSSLGNFFLKTPSSNRTASLLILYDASNPVSAATGEIWDVDSTETWVVDALGPGWRHDCTDWTSYRVRPTQTFTVSSGGNGLPAVFSFAPGSPIDAIRIDYAGPGPGLGFDNFTPGTVGTCIDQAPVAWWRGPTCPTNLPLTPEVPDSAPGASHGSWVPDPPVPCIADGVVQDAIGLDGTRYVHVDRPKPTPPHPDVRNLTIGDFTIENWILIDPATPVGLQPVLELSRPGTPGRTGYRFSVGTNNLAGGDFLTLLACHDGACVDRTNVAFQGAELNDGLFHHIAAVFHKATSAVQLFYDGSELTTVLAVSAPLGPADLMTLGRSQDGPTLMTGVLDEVTIYDFALTPAEIAEIHSGGSAGKCPSDFVILPGFGFFELRGDPSGGGEVSVELSQCDDCRCSVGDDCAATVATSGGQTAAQVVSALAAAANANPLLQAQGITAVAHGRFLFTNGGVAAVSISDAGLDFGLAAGPRTIASVPALSSRPLLVAVAALLATALASFRRRTRTRGGPGGGAPPGDDDSRRRCPTRV